MIQFPTTTDLQLAFGSIGDKEMQEWQKEATEAKYDQRYQRFASELFFMGGKITRKAGLDNETYSNGRRYLRKWLSSFDPKHEVKELVAGYILSRIAELPEVK